MSDELRKRIGPIERKKVEFPAWEFATRYHVNNRGERMDFSGRQYLADLYKVLTPEILTGHEFAIEKSPQIGGSEMFICLIFALAGELGWRVLYVLDRHATRERFVNDRVNKAIRRVPYYRQMLENAAGDADSLRTKDFGVGFICFAGSNTESEFIEMSADLVLVDEYDRCDLENVVMARQRLMARESKNALLAVSSPTHKGFGIDGMYEASTRHRWNLQCPVCSHWQPIFWDVNIATWRDGGWELRDREWRPECGRDIYVLCERCGQPLDRSASGRWISEDHKAKRIGYHVPKIIDASTPIAKAWDEWQEGAHESARKREIWYNTWLGVGYSESGSRLTPEMLEACIGRDADGRGYTMPDGCAGPCVAGIDVGVELHVHITDESAAPSRTVFIGRIPTSLSELGRLFARYHVRAAVFDADPEKSSVREWCARLNRGGVKAWRCRYKEDDLGKMDVEAAEQLVKLDRTMSLDDSHDDFAAAKPRVVLPADIRSLDGGKVVEQMCKPVRVIEERRGRMVAVWKKNPPEDYRHAVNYSHLARVLWRRYGGGSGRIVGGGKMHWGGRESAPDRKPSEERHRADLVKRRRGIIGIRGPKPF